MAWLVHNGMQYYVGYRQGANRKIRYVAAGSNKRNALHLRDEIAHRERLRKIGGTVIPEAVPFAEYLQTWRESRKVAPTTRQREESLIRLYLMPALGDRFIGDLKPADFSQLAAKLTAPTARRTLAVASKAMEDAVDNELIPRNPVRLPAVPRKVHEDISVNALCAIVAGTAPHWRSFTFWLLLTGCRFAEATAMTWADIDLDAGKVYVRRQKPSHLYGAEGCDPAPLKTEASHRAIDMLSPLRRMLLDLPQYGTGGILFPAVNGGYVSYSHYLKAWRKTMRTLQLKGVRIHTLRHAFGSLLLAFGEPLPYVTAQLGHTSGTFTLSTYLHQVKEGRRLDREATLAKLEAAFRGELAYTWLTPSKIASSVALKNAT